MTQKAIGIFGGSFDPVHKGHKKLALFMCEKLKLDKLLIIPTAMSPFKENSGAGVYDRLKMCSLEFSENIFEVSDIEIKRAGKSYTVDTVKSLKELYPDGKFYLIVGSDQLLSFDRWYKFREILESVTLCAVSRNGRDEKATLEKFAHEKLSKYGECMVFDFEPFEISSTDVRKKISENTDVQNYIGKSVYDYILTRGLYKNGN